MAPSECYVAEEEMYTVKKSLFVLASRQKIPVLRTENPAVDTTTIYLPPIEFYGRKIQARNNRYGRKILAFWSLEGDFLHSIAGKGKARKFRQVTTDKARKSGCQ